MTTYSSATVTGRFTNDADGNNSEWNAQTNSWDSGIANAKIELLNSAGQVVKTVYTDASGNYCFTGVSTGNYTVRFPTQSGKVFSVKDAVSDIGADSDANANGVTDSFYVDGRSHYSQIDAGVKVDNNASICGKVFKDQNDNSIDDVVTTTTTTDGCWVWKNWCWTWEPGKTTTTTTSEPGLGGVKVNLLNSAGHVVATTTTAADGTYKFDKLAAGNYTVEFVKSTIGDNSFVDANVGTNDAVDSDANQTTGRTGTITLTSGQQVCDVDAGVEVAKTAAIHGRVFNDANGNNVDNTEAGVGGVKVNLLNSAGHVIASTTTAADGSYSFTALAAGNYCVAFDKATTGGLSLVSANVGTNDAIDSDANQSTGVTGTICLTSGQIVKDVDAGVRDPGTGEFCGRVFKDLNNNSIDDASSTGGCYVQKGGCWYWCDATTAAEPGVGGVKVNLINAAGQIVATTTTASDGSYKFVCLKAGTYTVAFDKATFGGHVLVDQDVGTNNAIDSDANALTGITHPITLGIGEKICDIDAGLETSKTAAINGRVFNDANSNNVDDGEAGVGNVRVNLVNSAGVTVAFTFTAPNGAYSFTGLAAGNYTVAFDRSTTGGLTLVTANVGANDAIDSDASQTTGVTGTISLAAGQVVNDVDAGVRDPACSEVCGRVFKDLNDNSIDDVATVTTPGCYVWKNGCWCWQNGTTTTTAEPGVGGVKVNLINAAGHVVATTTTAADGSYKFTGVKAGTYTVQFDSATFGGLVLVDQNVGHNDAIDSDANPGTGITGSFTVGVCDKVCDVDGGLEHPKFGAIGDKVWLDANGNGRLDAGEAGISGLRVDLLNAAGVAIATTTTDANGIYNFGGLVAGTYQVQFFTRDGLVFTTEAPGPDDLDNDVSDAKADGKSDQIVLSAGEVETDIDAGLKDPNTAALGDLVFIDANGNGVFDGGDVGAAGVRVDLLNAAGAVIGTTTTDANGKYAFTGLAAGTYRVQFFTKDGLVFTTEAPGADDLDNNVSDAKADGRSDLVVLSAGEVENDIDAGLKDPKTAAINGRVFKDGNDNNQDDAEAGVGGVTVTLLNAAGQVVTTTVTAADGSYSFTGLGAGSYTVQFPTTFLGHTLVDPNVGPDATDSDAGLADGKTGTITLGAGQTVSDVDAGVEDPKTGSIDGRVFKDGNDNSQDDAEAGVGGVTVTLLNAAGVVVGTTLTAADGSYSFTGLGAGDYTVQFPTTFLGHTLVDPNVGPDATDSDAGLADGKTGTITLGAGQTVSDVDAGVEDPKTGSIDGRVFKDGNDNSQDDAEAGVGGVTVTLLNAAGVVVGTTLTAADGSYSFTGLAAGDYTVQFPTTFLGHTLVDPNVGPDATDSDAGLADGKTGTITLGAGQTVSDVDAGVEDPKTGSIDGRVFKDGNDNSQDDAEAGVGGVTVTLLNAAGVVVGTTLTAADGSYSFTGLGAGDYTVQFPTTFLGHTLVDPNVGPDATDSDAGLADGKTGTITLGAGQTVSDVDAGVEDPKTGSIDGRVFKDGNDNSQDDAEAGVGGVTVTLLNAAGVVVGTTLTAADGSYSFTGLGAGDYTVQFPTTFLGHTLVDPNVGPDATDSDAGLADGKTGTITLGAGQTVSDVDAGVEDPKTGSIDGRVFKDGNDNSQDDAEAGVGGVTVTLLNAAGVVVGTTLTAADGSYSFTGLGAGDYTVQFPTTFLGHTLVDPNVGPDATDSDAGLADGKTGTITLGAGQTVSDVDAGVEDPKTGSIDGRVFKDGNDNSQDDAEAGVGGVTVTLLNAAGVVVGTTLTAADGSYSFTGLAAGDYTVQFPTTFLGHTLVDPNVGPDATDSDAGLADGKTGTITLGAGQTVSDVDAGVEDPKTGSIDGRVFKDGNDNSQDDAEAGVGGVTVTLLNAAGVVVGTTLTAADGSYSFTGLAAGDYTVQFPTTFLGHTLVDPNVGPDATDSDAGLADGKTGTITLGAGQTVSDVDAGVEDPKTGSIDGRVFKDGNDNSQDDAEAGVGGVTVTLLNAAGVVVGTTLTAADGSYSFTGLAAGDYTVQFPTTFLGHTLVDPNVGPDATDSDAGLADGKTGTITLGAGQTVSDVDAGVEDPKTGSIDGRVFKDGNDNSQDDAEAGVGGVTVTLLNAAGVVVGTTLTAADGSYSFTGLGAGDYTVQFPTTFLGHTLVDPNVGPDATDSDAGLADGKTGTITLGAGQTVSDVDAGVEDPKTGSIDGRVFKDLNDDNQDNAEPGVSGVTVRLLNAAGVVVGTTTTLADGSYSFTGLAAGDYTVAFDTTTTGGLTLVDPNVGPDVTDSDAGLADGRTGTITLAAGQTVSDVDAGVEDPNTPPTPEDDADTTCAGEVLVLDVLANDTDPESDPLTVTSVDGQAISLGNPVTLTSGAVVTLNADGTISYDGTAVWADLLIGEEAVESFSYHVSDGRGGISTAMVDVTICGEKNTIGTITESLPDQVTYVLSLDLVTFTQGFAVDITVSPDARLFGVYEQAYCIDFDTPFNLGVPVVADVYGPTDDLPDGVLPNEENIDLVNWVLNQDFETLYSVREVQQAIWNLTSDAGFTDAEALQIEALARANGEGFLAGEGDIVGVVLDPVDGSQAFIIGVPFLSLEQDCLCLDP